ncbi:uncharacterized protein JCM10292_006407 [Rhodotorula paludigena]|uniref:uncharacterized protein n=1 Tax=Rhodotorula paludigena TaxID=86838 RepID=UPI0031773E10
MATMPAPPSNPHLASPRLFLSGVSDDVDDREIISVLQDCLRLRLDRSEGVVEFESLDRAEKAYATCNGQRLPSSTSTLNLSLSPPSSSAPDPVPSATPRLLKQLPKTMTASKLFDLARPFGPLFRVTLRYAPPRPFDPPSSSSQPHFTSQAILRYYDEAHAQAAYEGLNFLEVEGQNITVQVYDEKRAAAAAAGKGRVSDGARSSLGGSAGGPATPSRWATPSPSPSPSSAAAGTPSKYAGLGVSSNGEHRSPSIARSVSNSSAASASRWKRAGSPLDTPGTPPSGSPSAQASSGGMRRTASGSGIDPCNLYVKSLDPSLTTADLHALFAPYGEIVSARVQLDSATGRSREFGYVAFAEPGMARLAIEGLHRSEVRGRSVYVGVFEPKAVRGATRRSEGGMQEERVDEVRRGMESLSTTVAQPNRSPKPTSNASDPHTPRSSPPRAAFTKALSPLLDSPDAPASPEPTKTEHERLVEGVRRTGAVEEDQVDEVVMLLEQLPKRERAMCLFNPDVLKAKVQDALLVLSVSDEESLDVASSTEPLSAALPTSLAELAALSCAEIVPLLPRLARQLPLSQPAAAELAETDAFVDSIEGLPAGEMKQQLGSRLIQVVRAEAKKRGIKQAPRITIKLLDGEELRALARLMHYPEVLGEKVAVVAAQMARE